MGDKGLLRKYCDAKMELQTVGSGGGGGGGVGKQNELLMQDYRYFSSSRLHNHKKMLGREIILSHLINQN